MTRKPRILCIGTATVDVFLRGNKIFKAHREEDGSYYEQLPLGTKLPLDDVVFSTGGNAMNASVTFARQELDAEFMGIMGTEPTAQNILRVFDDEGIDIQHLVQDERFRTSYSTIILAPGGERTILNYHGSHVHDDGSPLDLSAIDDADWLYLSSLGSIPLLEKLITRAAKKGVKVALNPSGTELREHAKLRTLLDDVTVLLVNKEEMKLLVHGESHEELVRHGLHLVDTVVVSDGPRGVMVSDGKTIVKGGTYEEVEVIDRLGAGDAFGSGFVAMIAQGKSLEEAVTFASANSTSVVTKIGATAGILHRHVQLHDMPLKVKDV